MDVFLMILTLNAVFIASFFAIKNVFIAFLVTAISFFMMLPFFKQKKSDGDLLSNLKSGRLNFSDSQYTIGVICLVIFVILERSIGFQASLFASFFIFSHLNKLDSRQTFLIALLFLAVTAILTAGKNTIAAENTAITAYYFLVIGVIWQIINLWTNKAEVI